MNLQKKLRFGLLAGAAVAALFVTSLPANAQQLYKATFTLPFEAQWGNVVVEPGNYTITLEEALGQKLIRLHGPGDLAMLAAPGEPAPFTDNGSLTFVNVNGVQVLSKFQPGLLGQSFMFAVPKVKADRANGNPKVSETTTVALGTR